MMRGVSEIMFNKAVAYIEEAANFSQTKTDLDGNVSWWVSTETTDKLVAEYQVSDYEMGQWIPDRYLVHDKVYQAIAHVIDV